MKIVALAKIKNGTMNLPKEVRDLLKIGDKDKIVFFLENGRIYIQKA